MLNENLKSDKIIFCLSINEELSDYLKQIAKSKKITIYEYVELLILKDFATLDTNSKCKKCGADCPYFKLDKKYKPKNCDYFEELTF